MSEDFAGMHVGAILTTADFGVGDHEIMMGWSKGLDEMVPFLFRAFPDVATAPGIYPEPAGWRERAKDGIVGEVLRNEVENFDGHTFYRPLLNAVRKAHPGVMWVVGKPDGLRERDGRALYGYVGNRLVACIAEVRA